MIPLFQVFMAPEAPERVAETLASGYIGQGPRVEEFETALQREWGLDHPPVTVSSGTAAITLALRLIGITPGDEVISTPMTCVATNSPVALMGATIVWADIDPLTGLLDPYDAARKITPRTKAIIGVDWGGRRCDYRALRAPGLPVIQDAAHAFGPPGDDCGDYVCYSFQAIKHLTTGDGGALVSTSRQQADRARLLRWFGLDRTKGETFRCRQRILEIGDKLHMNDVAATIGLANLPYMGEVVGRHRRHAEALSEALGAMAETAELTLPERDDRGSWWLYTVQTDRRASLERMLRDAGIQCSQVHSRNDHHPAFVTASLGGGLPGVDDFTRRQLAIPVGWWLKDMDLALIVNTIGEWAIQQ